MFEKPVITLINASLRHDSKPTNEGMSTVRDNLQLEQVTSSIQESMKWRSVRTALDAILTATISYLTEPTGGSNGSFPLFSYAGYAGNNLSDKIVIHQNCVRANTLAEFLHVFKRVGQSETSEIKFLYSDRDSALELLSHVNSLASFREFFGDREKHLKIKRVSSNKVDHVSNLMTENHEDAIAALQSEDGFGSKIIAAKHSKCSEHPSVSEPKIRELIAEVQKKQFSASTSEIRFLNSLMVSLKLDLSYVVDRSSSVEIMEAMAIARQIDDKVLIANCQRFANKCLDMSSEALAMLEASCETLRKFPEFTEENGHILPSYFGSVSNRNTTILTQSHSLVDPNSMENDYWEAKSRLPTYPNIALLANAAGVAYMVKHDFVNAQRLLRMAVSENAEYVERLNVYCNLLLAQYLESGSYEQMLFEGLLNKLSEFDMGEHWEYLSVRMLLNLVRIATKPEHYHKALSICAKSSFWEGFDPTQNLDVTFSYFIKKRFHYYFENGRLKGSIGEFIDMYKIFPAIDKDYM